MFTLLTFLAQAVDPLNLKKIIPPGGGSYNAADGGLVGFINNGFKVLFVGFGLYAMVNFVLAAYAIISAQGEAKNIEKARKMITNSIVALFLVAMTFVFGGIIGQVFFGSWDYLLNPTATLDTIK